MNSTKTMVCHSGAISLRSGFGCRLDSTDAVAIFALVKGYEFRISQCGCLQHENCFVRIQKVTEQLMLAAALSLDACRGLPVTRAVWTLARSGRVVWI